MQLGGISTVAGDSGFGLRGISSSLGSGLNQLSTSQVTTECSVSLSCSAPVPSASGVSSVSEMEGTSCLGIDTPAAPS